jgi:hypothetical protein
MAKISEKVDVGIWRKLLGENEEKTTICPM